MKHKPARIVIALCVLAAACIAVFPYVRRILDERKFSRELAAAVHSGSSTVHFRSISSPEWDRVCIFGPYTDDAQISQTLGFRWNDSNVDELERSDGVNLLVFVKNQQVVMSVLHPRDGGDFAPGGYDLAKDDAEFSIVPGPGGILLTPVPKPRKASTSVLQ